MSVSFADHPRHGWVYVDGVLFGRLLGMLSGRWIYQPVGIRGMLPAHRVPSPMPSRDDLKNEIEKLLTEYAK